MIWLSRLPASIQPHLVARTENALDRLADVADTIVEATRGPAFQVAEAAQPSMFRVAEPAGVAALEARFSVQLTQLRLAMQQEVAEQLTAIK